MLKDHKQVDTKTYLRWLFGDTVGYNVHLHLYQNSAEQKTFSEERLLEYNFRGKNDFISMNSFKRCGHGARKKSNICQLRTLFADIDCYSVGMSAEEAFEKLEANEFGYNIPYPSFVVFSGQGLYLIWKIIPETKDAIYRWESVQLGICHRLYKYGADRKAIDASRVLRVPGSINAKPGVNKEVIAYHYSDAIYTLGEVKAFVGASFEEEADRYAKAVEEYEEKAEKKKAKELKRKEKNKKDEKSVKIPIGKKQHKSAEKEKYNPTFDPYYLFDFAKDNIHSRAITRAQDIANILVMHGKEVVGCRELGLFWIRYLLQKSGYPTSQVESIVYAVNDKLAYPLRKSEVKNATKVTPDKVYTPTKKYLREILGVTPSMDKVLVSLCSEGECYRRRQEKRGRTLLSSKDKQLLRHKKEMIMYGRGMSVSEICRTLDISRQTFYKDKEKWIVTKKDDVLLLLALICAILSSRYLTDPEKCQLLYAILKESHVHYCYGGFLHLRWLLFFWRLLSRRYSYHRTFVGSLFSPSHSDHSVTNSFLFVFCFSLLALPGFTLANLWLWLSLPSSLFARSSFSWLARGFPPWDYGSLQIFCRLDC